MLNWRLAVLVGLLTATAACATRSDHPERNGLGSLVENFAADRSDAMDTAMIMLDYDGVIVPHERGASRVLSDAVLEDINGIPGRELWFRVNTEPCYPRASLLKHFHGWEQLSDTIFRASSAKFTLQMSVEASMPACVTLMRFWTRDAVN